MTLYQSRHFDLTSESRSRSGPDNSSYSRPLGPSTRVSWFGSLHPTSGRLFLRSRTGPLWVHMRVPGTRYSPSQKF